MPKINLSSQMKGIIAGVVVCAIGLGFLSALSQQRGRLRGIAKAHYKNFFRHRNTADGELEKEIYGYLQQDGKEIVVFVNAERKIRSISPLLYGSNLSPQMETEADVMEFVKKTGIRVFRFPGGEQGYHWGKGAFDFTDRFVKAPLAEIDYVVELCKFTDAQLIIQVNVESGTPQEAAQWVEYMNKTIKFPVAYWELGNEVYGDWDRAFMDGKKYGRLIREYAAAMKKADPDIKIGMDWAPATRWFFNVEAVKIAGDMIDFASVHWYPNNIDSAHPFQGRIHPFPEEVMANYLHIPGIVQDIRKTFKKYAPNRAKDPEVTFLEWDGATDGPASDFSPYSRGIAQWSLANAIFYADSLGMMAMTGVSVSAQYNFQSIGYGLIRGWDKNAGWGGQRWDGEIVRPKALALELFSKYFGDVFLASRIQNVPFYMRQKDWAPETYGGRVPYVTVYASLSSKDDSLSIVLINKHEEKSFPVKFFVLNGQPAPIGRLYVLTGPSLMSQNEPDPMAVGIRGYGVRGLGKDFDYTAPPHSVSLIRVPMIKDED